MYSSREKSIRSVPIIIAMTFLAFFVASCGKDKSPTRSDLSPHGVSLDYTGSSLWRGLNDVEVSGDYAYCAMTYGLRVVNIADPSSTSFVSKLYMPSGESRRLTLNGKYAYLIGPDRGLQIVDVSDPMNPTKVGECQTPGEGNDVAVVGNYAYVADGTARVQIVDVASPQSPKVIGGVNIPDYASSIVVRDHYAYVAHGSAGLQILDLSTPASPTLVGTFDTPGWARDVALSGAYAYVADIGTIQVVNVSKLSAPTFVDSLPAPMGECVCEITAEGGCGYAFIGDNPWYPTLKRVQVVDLSNPVKPLWGASCGSYVDGREISAKEGQLYISDHEDGLHMYSLTNPVAPVFAGRTGVRGGIVDVALTGNYALVAAGIGGLRIIDISDPMSPTPSGTYRPPNSANAVTVIGDLAYVADSFSVQILGISNPLTPTYVGSFVTGPSPRSVFVKGRYAYVATSTSGMQILDVQNPSSPKLVSTYVPVSSPWDVVVIDTFAFIAGTPYFEVINIADLKNPYFVTKLDLSSFFSGHMILDGHYIYMSGEVVLDVADPKAPMWIAGASPMGEGDIAFQDKYVIHSTGNGLFVYDRSAIPRQYSAVGFWPANGRSAGVASDGTYIYLADTDALVVWKLH